MSQCKIRERKGLRVLGRRRRVGVEEREGVVEEAGVSKAERVGAAALRRERVHRERVSHLVSNDLARGRSCLSAG